MMRIVFDTNIVVSAMLSPSGTAADVLRLHRDHVDHGIVIGAKRR